MFRMIRIRNVPTDLRATLEARAAMAGLSLSDYLLYELRQSAQRPTVEEMRRRLASRASVRPRISPARAIRDERDR
jgi:hypothetical protein